MAKFYVMEPGVATKYYFLDLDLSSMGEAASKWSYGRLASFKGTARFEVEKGTTAADVLDTNCALIVVSDRLIEILNSNSLKGTATFEVTVVKDGKEIDGFNGLAIVGAGGPNDHSLVTEYQTPSGGVSRRIAGIRPTKWDGSSLFTCDDLYRIVLVTEEVVTAFKKARVTNCRFESAEDFRIGY